MQQGCQHYYLYVVVLPLALLLIGTFILFFDSDSKFEASSSFIVIEFNKAATAFAPILASDYVLLWKDLPSMEFMPILLEFFELSIFNGLTSRNLQEEFDFNVEATAVILVLLVLKVQVAVGGGI